MYTDFIPLSMLSVKKIIHPYCFHFPYGQPQLFRDTYLIHTSKISAWIPAYDLMHLLLIVEEAHSLFTCEHLPWIICTYYCCTEGLERSDLNSYCQFLSCHSDYLLFQQVVTCQVSSDSFLSFWLCANMDLQFLKNVIL